MSIDSVGSSYFSYADMQARMQQKVSEADTDSSGGLSFDEFQSLQSEAPMGPPPPDAAGAAGAEGAGGVGGAGGAGGTQSAQEQFDALDTNEDGEVSFEELEAGRPSFEPSFSSESFSELLAAQEESSTSSATSGSADDLIQQMMNMLSQSYSSTETSEVA